MKLQVFQTGVFAVMSAGAGQTEVPVGTIIPDHLYTEGAAIPGWLQGKVIDLDAMTPVTNVAFETTDPLIGDPVGKPDAPKPVAPVAKAASDKPAAPPEDLPPAAK
jgi:hypothetical protein